MKLTTEVKNYARTLFRERKQAAITKEYEAQQKIRNDIRDHFKTFIDKANAEMQEILANIQQTYPVTAELTWDFDRNSKSRLTLNVNFTTPIQQTAYYNNRSIDTDELKFMAELSAAGDLDGLEDLLDKYFPKED